MELSCLELPTGTNVLLDFDIIAQSAADVAYDDDISGGTSILASGGNIAKGQTITNETVSPPTTSHYLCLADGATSTDAQVFTAGKLTVRLYGRASF